TPVAMIDQSGLYSDAERRRYEISTLGRLVASIRRGEKECLRFSAVIDENPELRHDLDMEWLSGFRSRWSLRGYPQFFLAPGGTYTPVHCAMESNAFVQVHGQKHWILQSAMYQPLLDPPADRMPYFRTDFLPEQPSAQFPLGPYAPGMEVVLDPGDVLYVPPFVWHYVENLTATIAVAYRFFYIRHALRSSWPLTLAKALATRPSLFHTLVCPRRSLEKRCQVDGCPFALPDAS
ncbi:MAG TPA: cupin-like domain-containing protein, partial [Terriglobales bacterium]|nr:cupin-like domain-containing protein [Terriglobales bacterium]